MHRGEVWKKYKLYFIIRKSQFREHTGQETTGVKDNECVEPSTDGHRCRRRRYSIRDDHDVRHDPNAGGKINVYDVITIFSGCRRKPIGGDFFKFIYHHYYNNYSNNKLLLVFIYLPKLATVVPPTTATAAGRTEEGEQYVLYNTTTQHGRRHVRQLWSETYIVQCV